MQMPVERVIRSQNEADAAPSVTLPYLSWEVLAYVALLVMALMLRLADLDIVPMTQAEAVRALPAWQHIDPDSPPDVGPASSPVTFWIQAAAFSVLPGDEFTARLPGLIGGLLLVFMPLLFRRHLGTGRTLLLSLLLVLSPLALTSGRFAEPVVWSMIFALGWLWALLRYAETRQQAFLLRATAFITALAFLSEPGGPLLLLVLLLAAGLATVWQPQSSPLADWRGWLASVPWPQVLGLMVLLTAIGSSGFMLYPAGWSMIGALLEQMVSGFWIPWAPGTPVALPLLALLTYETFLIALAVVALVLLIRRGQLDFMARFLLLWLVIGALVLLLYRGASPAHALWLVVPLVVLVSWLGMELAANRETALFWMRGFVEHDGQIFSTRYARVKWALGLICLGLLLVLGLHAQELSRAALTLPISALSWQTLFEPAYITLRYSAIWLVIMLLFLITGYFLCASIWGYEIALQSLGLGVFGLFLITSMSAGWNLSVTNAGHAAELWHLRAVQPDAPLLRETLYEVAGRDTQGFPVLPLTVVASDDSDADWARSDGLLGWLLRDFVNARFVESPADAARDQVVIAPDTLSELDLGGSYVGQRFALIEAWDMAFERDLDRLAWLSQRRLRTNDLPQSGVVLWLRQDVYDGIPPDERPGQ